MVPIGTHEYNQYLNPEELENAIHPYGLKTVAKAGAMVNNPITMEMELYPNWLRGNYMMLARRVI